MAAIFMRSGYQNQLSFTTERTGIVVTFDGIVIRKEPQADGNLCAVEELAQQGDLDIDQIGIDDRLADRPFA